MAESAAIKKDPMILFLYQPKGVDARAVGKKSILVKDASNRYLKVVLSRGVNQMPRSNWELVSKTQQAKDLMADEQLFLIAESPNLIKDFISGQRTVNGEITIEKLINNCFNQALVEGWHSWIKQQDLTVGSKMAKLSIQISDRLAKEGAFAEPPPSIEPINPSRAIGYTNALQLV